MQLKSSDQSSYQKENLVNARKRLLENILPVFVCGNSFLLLTHPHVLLNLICFTISVTLMHLAQFPPNIKANKLQKSAEICLA